MKMIKNEWITTTEAALLTGYNNEYIRRLVRTEKVRARKFGIVWQVDRESLLEYMKKNERRGPRENRKS